MIKATGELPEVSPVSAGSRVSPVVKPQQTDLATIRPPCPL